VCAVVAAADHPVANTTIGITAITIAATTTTAEVAVAVAVAVAARAADDEDTHTKCEQKNRHQKGGNTSTHGSTMVEAQ